MSTLIMFMIIVIMFVPFLKALISIYITWVEFWRGLVWGVRQGTKEQSRSSEPTVESEVIDPTHMS